MSNVHALMPTHTAVSKSIWNDLEEAKGKASLCKSAIHKGQMFLSFLGTGRPYRSSKYHRQDSH